MDFGKRRPYDDCLEIVDLSGVRKHGVGGYVGYNRNAIGERSLAMRSQRESKRRGDSEGRYQQTGRAASGVCRTSRGCGAVFECRPRAVIHGNQPMHQHRPSTYRRTPMARRIHGRRYPRRGYAGRGQPNRESLVAAGVKDWACVDTSDLLR